MEAWLLNPVGKSPENNGELKEPSNDKKLEENLTEQEKIALTKYRQKVANLEKAREAKK